LNNNNLKILLNLPFYEYDEKYIYYKGILDYNIFDELDILVIENNNLNNNASSEKIINYCLLHLFSFKTPILNKIAYK
jgi:hypothetical protein